MELGVTFFRQNEPQGQSRINHEQPKLRAERKTEPERRRRASSSTSRNDRKKSRHSALALRHQEVKTLDVRYIMVK